MKKKLLLAVPIILVGLVAYYFHGDISSKISANKNSFVLRTLSSYPNLKVMEVYSGTSKVCKSVDAEADGYTLWPQKVIINGFDGDPNSSALDAVFDYNQGSDNGKWILGPDGYEVINNIVEVKINRKTTIGELNAFMEKYRGEIISTVCAHGGIIVAIPPQDIQALVTMIREMKKEPGIVDVHDSGPRIDIN